MPSQMFTTFLIKPRNFTDTCNSFSLINGTISTLITNTKALCTHTKKTVPIIPLSKLISTTSKCTTSCGRVTPTACNLMTKLTRKRKKITFDETLMNINGKIALITGGTSGIGLATADALIYHDIGHVFITGNDPCEGKQAVKKLNATHGGKKCSFIHLNVISDAHFHEVFSYIENEYNGVDILFNNAGILDDSKWELEVETNFKSMIRGNLIGLQYMCKGKNHNGRSQRIIINNSDIFGLEPLPTAPIYSATKYGVIGITKCLGNKYHFKESKVRIVALCCGPTDTKLLKDASKKQLNEKWGKNAYKIMKSKGTLTTDEVSQGVIHIIKYAPNNSVWSIENKTLYFVNMPKPSEITSKVLKLC